VSTEPEMTSGIRDDIFWGGGGGGGERLKNVTIVLEEKATCRRYRMTNQNRFWKESDHWARDKK
jgi:hypothetical protein